MAYLGIDPGQSGGLALIDGDRVECCSMPLAGKAVDWRALTDWIEHLDYPWGKSVAYVEKVSAMPKQGVSSTFKFGLNVGGIHGVLGALGIPMVLVTPQAWKKRVLAGTTKDKAAAIDYCRRRWPHISLLASERCRKPHDGMADALCLARFAQMVEGGQ